jgi:hypothetical protein
MDEQTAVIERAVEAYQALADLAEAVEDEWQYVTDLSNGYTTVIQPVCRMWIPDGPLPSRLFETLHS